MKFKDRKKQKGQSLVEYLMLVALMGVATLGVVRLLGHTVSGKFAQVVQSLNGTQKQGSVEFKKVESRHYEEKDMSSFMKGSRKGL